MPKEIKKTKAVKVKAKKIKAAKAELVSEIEMPNVKLSVNYTKRDYAIFAVLLVSFFMLFMAVSGWISLQKMQHLQRVKGVVVWKLS